MSVVNKRARADSFLVSRMTYAVDLPGAGRVPWSGPSKGLSLAISGFAWSFHGVPTDALPDQLHLTLTVSIKTPVSKHSQTLRSWGSRMSPGDTIQPITGVNYTGLPLPACFPLHGRLFCLGGPRPAPHSPSLPAHRLQPPTLKEHLPSFRNLRTQHIAPEPREGPNALRPRPATGSPYSFMTRKKVHARFP